MTNISDSNKGDSNKASEIERLIRSITLQLIELDEFQLVESIRYVVLAVQECPELHKIVMGKLFEIQLYYQLYRVMSQEEENEI